MIARPNISRNEWKTAEKGRVGLSRPCPAPVFATMSAVTSRPLSFSVSDWRDVLASGKRSTTATTLDDGRFFAAPSSPASDARSAKSCSDALRGRAVSATRSGAPVDVRRRARARRQPGCGPPRGPRSSSRAAGPRPEGPRTSVDPLSSTTSSEGSPGRGGSQARARRASTTPSFAGAAARLRFPVADDRLGAAALWRRFGGRPASRREKRASWSGPWTSSSKTSAARPGLPREYSKTAPRSAREHLRGPQIFNPTSMFAYATVLTQAFRLCFENSTRAIDSSKS